MAKKARGYTVNGVRKPLAVNVGGVMKIAAHDDCCCETEPEPCTDCNGTQPSCVVSGLDSDCANCPSVIPYLSFSSSAGYCFWFWGISTNDYSFEVQIRYDIGSGVFSVPVFACYLPDCFWESHSGLYVVDLACESGTITGTITISNLGGQGESWCDDCGPLVATFGS